MAQTISWYYHRSGCTSCKRAREYFAEAAIEPEQTQAAGGKTKIFADEALAMARAARTVVVAKGQKALVFDMKNDPPSDDDLQAAIVGRSGTLRAPCLKAGDKLIVGYNGDLYPAHL